MVITRYFESNGIPLVFCEKEHPQPIKRCILFYHGFKGAKEKNLRELNSLAEQGYFVVGVDAVGHGARIYPDFDARFAGDSSTSNSEFIKVVCESAAEVPYLIDTLNTMYTIKSFGIAGISMGGFITYAAILQERRLQAAVSILGSPHWEGDEEHSPERHLEKFSSVHLLSMNAGKDELVPSHFARDFQAALKDYYTDYEQRFAYVEYPNSDHFIDDEDWINCWGNTLRWFDEHLSPS